MHAFTFFPKGEKPCGSYRVLFSDLKSNYAAAVNQLEGFKNRVLSGSKIGALSANFLMKVDMYEKDHKMPENLETFVHFCVLRNNGKSGKWEHV